MQLIDLRISRYIFYSYRDKAWAWRCLEHFLKCLPSHTYVQLGLKALTLVRVFSFSVGIETRMISNDWYTSFLCSVGIIDYDYDGLASSQKRKCLVILRTILVFSTIPCFVYHSLLTKAKPEAVKSQTSKNTRSFKQIKMNLNQMTKNGKASTWRLDWARRMSVMNSWWSGEATSDTCRQHNYNSNKTSCYHKAHYSKDNFWVLRATFNVF